MSDIRESGDPPPQVAANQEGKPEVAPDQGAEAPAPDNNQPTSEDVKAKYGYHIILAGLALVTVLYITTIIIFASLTPDNLANNVVASMGAITGVIGSLVAAYFGLQAGAAGKEASDAKAEKQSALASAAMGQLNADDSKTAIQNAQDILQTASSE
jgi:hypothetical protein